MVRTIIKRYEGMMLPGAPLARAEEFLKNKSIGDRVYIEAYNGQELFVKTEKGVRVSTQKEFDEYNKRRIFKK